MSIRKIRDDKGGTMWTGGLRKVDDLPRPCQHPEHNPPGNIVLQPGVYEHTCPGCGAVTRFGVPWVMC